MAKFEFLSDIGIFTEQDAHEACVILRACGLIETDPTFNQLLEICKTNCTLISRKSESRISSIIGIGLLSFTRTFTEKIGRVEQILVHPSDPDLAEIIEKKLMERARQRGADRVIMLHDKPEPVSESPASKIIKRPASQKNGR